MNRCDFEDREEGVFGGQTTRRSPFSVSNDMECRLECLNDPLCDDYVLSLIGSTNYCYLYERRNFVQEPDSASFHHKRFCPTGRAYLIFFIFS